jgi:hypothetical protein
MPTATKTASNTKPTINWFFFKQLSDPRKYFSDSMLPPSRNEWRKSFRSYRIQPGSNHLVTLPGGDSVALTGCISAQRAYCFVVRRESAQRNSAKEIAGNSSRIGRLSNACCWKQLCEERLNERAPLPSAAGQPLHRCWLYRWRHDRARPGSC